MVSENIKDINIAALDYKNFGQSESPNRGCIESFDDLLEQAENFIQMMSEKYSKPKIFIGGLSLGGAISFRLSIRNKNNLISGLVMMSPALRDNDNNMFLLKKVGKVVGYLFPNMKVAPPIFTDETK